MNDESSTSKKKIFNEELLKLKNENYINNTLYDDVSFAYEKYHNDKIQIKPHEEITEEKIEKVNINKPIREKIVLSSEQIRERNITWSLILGVIMLLIGGLILSTNNWDIMNGIMKVSTIATVSILFLGLSWFTNKVLKIEKTSFAFLTLGSLFVPIVFIASGYLKLFGEWFSLTGEGKYILGLLASGISLGLYSFNAKRHNSRLFVWLSLLASTSTVGFLLASFKLSIDIFYLGIMLYNALILYFYHKYKQNEKIQWFSKEIPHFAQLNLIISTLLMLFFFQNNVFYSFNILLTAILYISMIFVYKSKHYHFVFTALLMYGIYQLTLHTPLEHIKEILFASIAFIYVGIQSSLKNENYLQKAFQLTSAIISFFAFVYISIQGLILESQSNGIVMFIATVIVAINYIYLSHITSRTLFIYLANIFSIISGYQLFKVTTIWSNYVEVFMFIYVGIVFYLFYYNNRFVFLQKLKDISLLITNGSFIIIIGSAFINEKWLTTSLLLISFSIIVYLITIKTNNLLIKNVGEWINPISLLLSIIAIFPLINNQFYLNKLGIAFHFALTSLILLAISYLYKQIKKYNLFNNTFYISQGLYFISLLFIIVSFNMDWNYVVPLLLLIGIAMFTLLTIKTKIKYFWILVGVVISFSYLSLINTFNIIDLKNKSILTAYILLTPFVMLILSKWLKRIVKEAEIFIYTVGQGFFFIFIFSSLRYNNAQ